MRPRWHTKMTGVLVSLALLCFTLLAPLRDQAMAMRPAATPSPISIGLIVSLTGINARFPNGTTRYQLAAAELAVRQINAHGGIRGRSLRLVVADDRSSTAGAIAAFEQLTRTDHVAAIVGLNSSDQSQALRPYNQRVGIPLIVGGQVPVVTPNSDPWVFDARPNLLAEAAALADFAVSRLHLTRIALLNSYDNGGKAVAAALQADLKTQGVHPVADLAFPDNAADMTAQVLALKKVDANGVISHVTTTSDYLLLARQMQEVGLHLTWLGSSVMAIAPTRQEGGALFFGTYAATDYAVEQSPEAIAFNQTLEATYHLPGVIWNAYIYDGINLLAQVMRTVGTAPQAIRQGLRAIRGYRGAEGTYTFDRYGEGMHQVTIVQNVQGRLRVVKVFLF